MSKEKVTMMCTQLIIKRTNRTVVQSNSRLDFLYFVRKRALRYSQFTQEPKQTFVFDKKLSAN